MTFNQNSSSISPKIKLLSFILIAWFLFLVAHLFYLQIVLQHTLFLQGQRNFIRIESIPSPRGDILDCKGKLLATNRPVINVYWKGTGNRTLTSMQQTTLETIESIVGFPRIQSLRDSILRTEKSSTLVKLVDDISMEQLSKLLELLPNHPNVIIKSHFKRFYPHQTLACHILGYISHINAEMTGKMGLEKIVHERLQGQKGKIRKMINSFGTNLQQEEIQKALVGNNIQTTLDLSLQQIAENIFPSHYTGALILMNPRNGALKVVLSRPHFDPNIFLDHLSSSQWETMQEGRPFLNRAFSAAYPPASIFKLITITVGLELGLINQEDTIVCKGYKKFKGRKYYCHNRLGHGTLNVKECLAKSCNILPYNLALKISIDQLASYAHKFGLGEKTGVLFPEHVGLIPTSAWKLQEKGESWWPGETLSASIGQSYLLASPIQALRVIAGLFEGFLVNPRILESEPIVQKELGISANIRQFLKDSMEMAVQSGTGIYVSRVSKDIKIYAKTGTAQTTTLKSDEETIKQEELHAWFVSYFQYKDHEPLAFIIFIEHAGGSQIATNIAKIFLMNYVKRMNEEAYA